VLEQDGHSVVTAEGGEAGIESFRQSGNGAKPFDLVITDLGMPFVDGREVAAAVKAADSPRPVILMTGWGHRLRTQDEIPEFVDRVLGKPPKLLELRRTLAELTRSSRSAQEDDAGDSNHESIAQTHKTP
jgi:DNA-binding response OmpR family regulator